MEYDVAAVADDLMLTVAELREILEIYIDEAIELLDNCQQAACERNYSRMAQTLHSLKGASNNLRLGDIGEMAAKLEHLVLQEQAEKAVQVLPELRQKVYTIRDFVGSA